MSWQSLAISSGVLIRIKPVYPCHGYGFSAGTEFPTRTRTPGKPSALTRGFSKPVPFPTNDKRQALVNAVELYESGVWTTGRAEDWESEGEEQGGTGPGIPYRGSVS